MLAQVHERRANSCKVTLLLDQRAQRPSLRSAQCGVEHFTHARRPQDFGVHRVLQALQQALDRCAHRRIQRR